MRHRVARAAAPDEGPTHSGVDRRSHPARDGAIQRTTVAGREPQARRSPTAGLSDAAAGPGGAEPARARTRLKDWLWLVGRLFPPGRKIDWVTTRASFEASPEAMWQALMFYEEVPHRPPWLLRALLPTPMRTRGGGKHAGDIIECTYSRGRLLKRITVVERPHLLRFEVIEQQLGVERCFVTIEGSYAIRATGRGSEVALTTRYRGHLRPRTLWRPFERLLAHQLHSHILAGMRVRGADPGRPLRRAAP